MCASKLGDGMTIGQVVKQLSGAYPDLSVSKVRFLENEGLITPHRSPSGYRLYSDADVKRLSSILRMQKTYFYPLSVIKEKLAQADEGLDLKELSIPAALSTSAVINKGKHPLERVPELLGIEIGFVRKLGEFGLIAIEQTPKGREVVDGIDFPLIQAASELNRHGVEPRHLRIYVTSVNRERVIFEQVLASIVGLHHGEVDEEDSRRFKEVLSQMETCTDVIRGALLHRALHETFPGNV